VRIWQGDARLLLEQRPDASLNRVFLLFPDPWPKARHHKRRIVDTAFLDLLAAKMHPGAELRIVTDHEDYGAWILAHCSRHSSFEWTATSQADWQNPPADWVPTRYQQKAAAEGRQPLFLIYRRCYSKS